MNRRSFFKTLATAAAAFTILPSAVTYGRTWAKKTSSGIYVVNPAWVNAPYEVGFYFQPYEKFLHPIVFQKGAGEVIRNPMEGRYRIDEPWPIRFASVPIEGLKPIPPIIELA